MVESLLQRGSPLEVRDRAGNLPWHFAVHGKAVDLVNFLLDRGCPLDAANDSGQNALHFAAETGANQQQRHRFGSGVHTGSDVLCKAHCICRVDQLSTRQPTNLKQTSGEEAVVAGSTFRYEGLTHILLMRIQSACSAYAKQGGSGIRSAVAVHYLPEPFAEHPIAGSLAMVEALLERGAAPDAACAAGKTALHYAAAVRFPLKKFACSPRFALSVAM